MLRLVTIIALLFVCTIVQTNDSLGQWVNVRCSEDGVSTRVPREPSSSYRLYGAHYESEYRSSQKALGSLMAKHATSDSLRDVLKEFRAYLGNERKAIETQLQKSVTRIQKNPCDSLLRRSFHFLLENVDINARRLNKISVACGDTSIDLGGLLREYLRDEE
ncbi:MAG TPA: hypothetical protein VMM37_09785 [Bacteroidota bacterium]|nr:hypothetical protein [Bacteroidota bacterium]